MERIIIPIVILAAVIVAVLGYRGRGGEDAGIAYDMATAEVKPLWVKVSATGLVKPFVEVEVKSKASGVVIALPLEPGDPVRNGQVIARLDTEEILNPRMGWCPRKNSRSPVWSLGERGPTRWGGGYRWLMSGRGWRIQCSVLPSTA